jgi:hypothetical protein
MDTQRRKALHHVKGNHQLMRRLAGTLMRSTQRPKRSTGHRAV